jgi:uncharacterized membrane protein YgaE (UPF0421/DUF939 family)
MDPPPLTPITSLQLAARAAASAVIALALAQELELEYPIYALIAAIVVMDLDPVRTRDMSLQRIVGTFLGAIFGIALSLTGPINAWTIGIGILASMWLCHPLKLEGAEKLTGFVCAIVMFDHAGMPVLYAFHRMLETLLGVGVSILASVVPKLLRER